MKHDTVLEAQDVVMRFGGVTAVDGASMKLKRNELRCLIGPNGAGKSSFFKCLSGQLVPTEGDIILNGEHVAGRLVHEIARMGVALKTQVPSLMNGLSVHENLWLGGLAGKKAVFVVLMMGWGVKKTWGGGARPRHSRADANAQVERLIGELGLAAHARSLAGALAHGQRQMVELGVVLA